MEREADLEEAGGDVFRSDVMGADYRCRAHSAQIRHLRPDSGLEGQILALT